MSRRDTLGHDGRARWPTFTGFGAFLSGLSLTAPPRSYAAVTFRSRYRFDPGEPTRSLAIIHARRHGRRFVGVGGAGVRADGRQHRRRHAICSRQRSGVRSPGAARVVDVSTPGAPALEVDFEQSEAFKWLEANAASFGFVMTLPRGNRFGYRYEPWHWCYVGTGSEC